MSCSHCQTDVVIEKKIIPSKVNELLSSMWRVRIFMLSHGIALVNILWVKVTEYMAIARSQRYMVEILQFILIIYLRAIQLMRWWCSHLRRNRICRTILMKSNLLYQHIKLYNNYYYYWDFLAAIMEIRVQVTKNSVRKSNLQNLLWRPAQRSVSVFVSVSQ